MKQNSFMKDMGMPVIVLVAICLVVAALLSMVHGITEPIIEENARVKAEQTRIAVLPGASAFEEVACDTAALKVDSIYKETTGKGYVITASNKGYGGPVVVTLGLDGDGKVVGISVDTSTETTGVGSKASASKYTDNYLGAAGSVDGIETISGATYSSSAVKKSVQAALDAFASVR